MDDSRVGCKLCQQAGDAVVKASTDGDQQVAIGDGEVGVGGAMHPQHANGEGIVLIKDALAHQGGGHRNPVPLGNGVERLLGAC